MLEMLYAFGTSFIACFAFCFILNVRDRILFFAPLGGALCWVVYEFLLPFAPMMVCYFSATVALSIYAELLARLLKTPVTSFLLIGLLPLVPGGGIYYTMEYALAGEFTAFLSKLLETISIAGCLALGVLVVSTVVRFGRLVKKHAKKDCSHLPPA
ncbi:threonine/serine exporter family protein [Pygmaiobacter massiliensis]|uniref:threonine/serine exporter family protein n=1 Tax=Pygmaiobacter massiliensis TaxID=1917873 RepID=UPI000C7E308E|nr:threonine/serine exporter family protein [Pygmaiobacter massiliensis]